jgi:hypothetical protein
VNVLPRQELPPDTTDQQECVNAIFWGSSGSPQRSVEKRRIDREERKTLVQSWRHGISTRSAVTTCRDRNSP